MNTEEIKIIIEQAKREKHYTLRLENKVGKQYVLSKYTPKQDAIGQIGEEKGNKQTTWIILGFALGYVVKELLEKISDELNIIVIEPNKEILDAQMAYEGNEHLRCKENVHFLYGDINKDFIKKLSKLIPDGEIYNINIVSMKVYFAYYIEYYKKIKSTIKDIISSRIININTVKKYSELYTQNIIKNRYAIGESYSLEELKGRYKDIPALIVSAGPSLSKNIEWIKDFKGLILVGNRTLAPVIEQGVKPHLMFAVDPEDIILDTTRGTMQDDIPLVANDNSNYKLVAAHPGKKYFINTESTAKSLLGVDITSGIPMGGSVATLCASVAAYMECNPIICIGQDCAYTDMKIYSSDCANTLFTDEMRNDSDFIWFDKVQIDEYYGGKVWSSMDLVSFVRWFENFIEANPQLTFINATEGGAYIKGAINKPFKDVVKEYQAEYIPDLSKYDKIVEVKESVDTYLDRIYELLNKLVEESDKAMKISIELEKEYKLYKGKREANIRKLIKRLDQVDEALKESKEIGEVTAMIFSSLHNDHQLDMNTKAQINASEVEEGIRVSKESYSLYSNIKEASKRLIKLIEENK